MPGPSFDIFFSSVLVAFVEERIFGGPYSAIPNDVTLICFLSIKKIILKYKDRVSLCKIQRQGLAQTGLELLGSSDSPTSASQGAGITSMNHHA